MNVFSNAMDDRQNIPKIVINENVCKCAPVRINTIINNNISVINAKIKVDRS